MGSAAGKKTLAKVASWLRSVGAKPSNGSNKLQRALGVDSAQARRSRVGDGAPKPGTVGALVADYLTEQCEVIACNDIALRVGEPVVHKTRVAVRRLRSTLRVFGDVVQPEQSSALTLSCGGMRICSVRCGTATFWLHG